MFVLYDRTAFRLIGAFLNGALVALPIVGVFGIFIWVACMLYYTGMVPFWKYILILVILLGAESYVSLRTFFPEVSLGPNSALQNLPLLFVDMSFVSLYNVLVLSTTLGEKYYIFYGYIRIDTIPKVLLIGLCSLRYIGLAWTDEKFILKRIFAPIRYEKQLDDNRWTAENCDSSPHGHPLNLKMMASPSTSASPQPQPSKNEIETFNRQYVPIFVFLLSFANVGILWWQVETNFMDIPYSTGPFVTIISTVLSFFHFIYFLTLLLAPRFLYRGIVWLKALPWIIINTSILVLMYMVSVRSNRIIVYCTSVFIIQLIQFIICIIPEETPISFLFKPYNKVMVPNLLAKIDLLNPNADLDSIFGPPVMIPSGISGQQPTIIRYGSQATNVSLNISQPIISTPQPQPQIVYPSEKSLYSASPVPSMSPPVPFQYSAPASPSYNTSSPHQFIPQYPSELPPSYESSTPQEFQDKSKFDSKR